MYFEINFYIKIPYIVSLYFSLHLRIVIFLWRCVHSRLKVDNILLLIIVTIDNIFFSGTIGVEKGAIEITNCFCVPHNESKEEVSM